jgi:COP9 signalosome complex subunit 4
MLKGIPLDSGHRTVSNDYKCRIYIKIVQLFLEDEDAVSADAYSNRISSYSCFRGRFIDLGCGRRWPSTSIPRLSGKVFHNVVTLYRAFDFKRQFLFAASKYLQLSYRSELSDAEQIGCLINAITCTVLAGAGPQRSRMLATLYKDDRVKERSELQESLSMLKKMVILFNFSILVKYAVLMQLKHSGRI